MLIFLEVHVSQKQFSQKIFRSAFLNKYLTELFKNLFGPWKNTQSENFTPFAKDRALPEHDANF